MDEDLTLPISRFNVWPGKIIYYYFGYKEPRNETLDAEYQPEDEPKATSIMRYRRAIVIRFDSSYTKLKEEINKEERMEDGDTESDNEISEAHRKFDEYLWTHEMGIPMDMYR